jgi:hypothetical protein
VIVNILVVVAATTSVTVTVYEPAQRDDAVAAVPPEGAQE